MRGRPLVEMLMFLLVWCALSIPLWRLTRTAPAAAVAGAELRRAESGPTADVVLATPTWATVRLAHPADALTLSQDGELLLQRGGGDMRVEAEVPLRLRAGVATVSMDVTWPPAVEQSVVEVTLEPDGLPAQSQRLWGRGSASTIMEFRWAK
ncbi:MAG: hypothetical protein K8T26_00320 [Lentisphaerae bacterium]|nr:hypothetical protein [Lentisphaerota bacterium]